MAPTSGSAYDRRWWTLLVLSISLLVISLDNTILNVALPTIERDLGASSSQLQWIVDSYTLVFAGLLLTLGSLGDRFGRRLGLVIGLVVFGAGSLASALATSADMLIVTRGLMGVGGALIMPSTLSILTNVFPAHERPKAIGIWAAVAGLGIAIGPVGGGWLIEHFDWGSVFLVNLPVVAVALAAIPAFVPESRDPAESRLDPLGALLSTAGLGVLTWAIIEGQNGWTETKILAGFAFAIVTLTAFVIWELRTETPMLDVRLFRLPRFSGASASIALVFFALFGAIFFLTMYLQEVKDYSALSAGVRVTPIALGLILGGPLSAKLAGRLGTRIVVAAGLTTVAAALFVMSGMTPDTGYGVIGGSLVLMGLGMGTTMAPATESIMSTLPLAHAGVGSAMNDTVRMVGGTLGVAILGSLLSSQYGANMHGAVAGLPEPARSAAEGSIGGAGAVAQHVGGHAGATLNSLAETAYTSAMGTTLTVAAAVALAGALVALTVLPGRERERAEKGVLAVEGAAA
ncbi:MAG TPA: MFS transporter [Thermoleophilaceae bacterium]|jgi:EmrB/QacA subfamily drug resistance transporter|nr:MFS transporter [Thermoleophilaceae bacterium]